MFAGLVSYIEQHNVIVNEIFIFVLTELHSVISSLLGEFGAEKNVYKTRLKLQIFNHFIITFLAPCILGLRNINYKTP